MVEVKFAAPLVARPMRSAVPDPNRVGPELLPEVPNFTASATITGREITKMYEKRVRLRFICRYNSRR